MANGAVYIYNIQITWIESATPSISIDQSDFRLYTSSEVRQLTVIKRNAESASFDWNTSNYKSSYPTPIMSSDRFNFIPAL